MDEGEVVRFDAVRRSFSGPDCIVEALRGVSLTVQAGELVAVAGPSGSGKTTLLNLAGGLDRPSAGSVRLLGRQLDGLSGRERDALRRRVGFVFQSSALLPSLTAGENVELALRVAGGVQRRAWASRVRRCLQVVGLEAWQNHRAAELSGGQQQRVALARALAARPAFLLADEPTGHLDEQWAGRVWALLRELCVREGMAVVVATHDPAVERFATARYALRDGALIRLMVP